jgi:hypothetical protein
VEKETLKTPGMKPRLQSMPYGTVCRARFAAGLVIGFLALVPLWAGSGASGQPVTPGDISREFEKLERSEDRGDFSGDAVFANFREIKMGSIRPGLLYRSRHPALSDSRSPYAAKLAQAAGISAIVDLADTPEELVRLARSVPWYEYFLYRKSVIALGMGYDYYDSVFNAKLKKALLFMLEKQGPFLIHCNEGRDRTGFTALLLEALMGAPAEEIIKDYMQTFINYYNFVPGEERYRIISQIAINHLDRISGGKGVPDIQNGAEKYLVGKIGLSRNELKALKAKLSAGAPQ